MLGVPFVAPLRGVPIVGLHRKISILSTFRAPPTAGKRGGQTKKPSKNPSL